jgi:DNA mismatch repair ATPase MutL
MSSTTPSATTSSATTRPSATTPSSTTRPSATTPSSTTQPSATTSSSATTPSSTTSSSATTPSSTTSSSNETKSDNFYDNQTMMMTLAFLGVYFSIFAIMNMLGIGGMMVDTVVLIVVLVLLALYYFSLDQSEKDSYFKDLAKGTRDYFNNAYSILEVVIFIALFYLGTYILKIPMNSEKPVSISFLESKAFLWLVILVFVQFFKTFLGIRIVDMIYDMDFSGLFPNTTPKEASKPSETTKAETKTTEQTDQVQEQAQEEVFNISNNLYTYEDAGIACEALGAQLANYDQIEESYDNGAEWTSYGWSDGQHAYFPTQKKTWEKLQSIKGHEHDLGRPGVNGGYFQNPNIRFGANCYGVKPKMTDAEKALMDSRKSRIYPKSPEDTLLDKKVNFFMNNKDKLMVINSYNNQKWSKY